MRTLSDIPDHIIGTFPQEVRDAINAFTPKEARELKAFYQLETGEFDCIGFAGPGGKVTKPADEYKYRALLILEEQYRKDLQ